MKTVVTITKVADNGNSEQRVLLSPGDFIYRISNSTTLVKEQIKAVHVEEEQVQYYTGGGFYLESQCFENADDLIAKLKGDVDNEESQS